MASGDRPLLVHGAPSLPESRRPFRASAPCRIPSRASLGRLLGRAARPVGESERAQVGGAGPAEPRTEDTPAAETRAPEEAACGRGRDGPLQVPPRAGSGGRKGPWGPELRVRERPGLWGTEWDSIRMLAEVPGAG